MNQFNYKADNVNVIINGINIEDIAEEGSITVSRAEDEVTTSRNTAGGGTYNISTSREGTISIPMMSNSLALGYIVDFHQVIKKTGKGFFSLLVEDSNEGAGFKHICAKAQLVRTPDLEYGQQVGVVELQFICLNLESISAGGFNITE